jgi:hypothetical protein
MLMLKHVFLILNSQIEHKTRIKYFHVYEKIPWLDKNWTPIERKFVEKQIKKSFLHYYKNQFPIQLVISCTIHHSQRVNFQSFNI